MQLLLPYPVTLTVACRTTADARGPATRHPVTLEVDGSVTTPHDLDAERIAAALGGHLSCLGLIDHAVPAFRSWVLARLREEAAPITSTDQGATWSPSRRATCCRTGWSRPDDAAAHGRDAAHHAALHGADPRQLRELITAAAIPEPKGPGRGEPWASAWRCGLAPDRVTRLLHDVPCREVLPAEFHLAVMVRQPDLAWLASTLAELDGDARMATWLAWTMEPADRRNTGLRHTWLHLGVPPRAVLPLQRAGYLPDDVVRLAASWRRTAAALAGVLLGWVEHGYRPDVEVLFAARFRHLAAPPLAPAEAMVARLRDEVGDPLASDTDLAVALVRHGTVWHAARALRRSG